MKMMYRVNDLTENVNTVFPTMPEYQSEEWYQQLARHFDDILECDYWHRIINRIVDKDDFVSLLNFVQKKIKLYLYTNEYKVSNLYESTQYDYNPLWNVDGTETRELSREVTGEDTDTFNETNTLARTGNDTTSHSGYTELVKSGNDTTTDSGYTELVKSGNDTTTNSGYTELVKTGNETTSNSGYDEVVKTGTNTVTTSKTTMNSATFYDTDKTVEQPNLTERTNLNSTNQVTHNTNDRNNISTSNQTTHNTTDRNTLNTSSQTTHNTTDRNNVNTTNQTTHNTTDRNNLNDSEQTSYNSTNTDSHTGTVSNEKSNTETLTETTTRQGNIGVTKTTELIESQRQIVNFNFINYICHEIVNEFTILVD